MREDRATEISEDDRRRGERDISRTVADADGYALAVGGSIGRSDRVTKGTGRGRGKERTREKSRRGKHRVVRDLMLTGIKINGQPCTLTCHLIPPCVILIDQ